MASPHTNYPQIIYDSNRDLLISQDRNRKVTLYHPMSKYTFGRSKSGKSDSKKYYLGRLKEAHAEISPYTQGDSEEFRMRRMWYRKTSRRVYESTHFLHGREQHKTIQFYPYEWYTEAGLYIYAYNLI